MRQLRTLTFCLAAGIGISLAGCSSSKAPDVTGQIRNALDQAGLKDVSTSQDRTKEVVTLSGHVPNDADKDHAEQIAKSYAGNEVVSNQIAVWAPGAESQSKTVNSDLDKGIEKDFDAAMVKSGLKGKVDGDAKNGVLTLTGTVNTLNQRTQAEQIAAAVPNVQQVVNELQIKNEPASTTRSRTR